MILNEWNNKIFAITCVLIMVIFFSCRDENLPEHFNNLASNKESQPKRVVESLRLKEGDTVADIGCGGGYFSIAIARKVGNKGKVYAVDIDKEMLKYVNTLANKEGVNNIITVLATESNIGISGNYIDLIFMRNVFHDLKNDTEYFIKLRSFLNDTGRIAIIDYRPGNFIMRLFGHYVYENEIVSLMKSAGYKVVERYTYLEDQYFNIFSPVMGTDEKSN